MTLSFHLTSDTITLSVPSEKPSFFKRIFKRNSEKTLKDFALKNSALSTALTELKSLANAHQERLSIDAQNLTFSHELAAKIDNKTAENLGLPPLIDFTLTTDCKGRFGKEDFKLTYEWTKNGKTQIAKRIGSFVETEQGFRRIPPWILNALNVADNAHGGDYARDWQALAHFRQALAPSLTEEDNDIESESAHIAMSDFLRGLKINLSDSFSLTETPHKDDTDFDIIPFKKEKTQRPFSEESDISENDGELSGSALERFQQRIRTNGASSAYQVAKNHFLVIDPDALPILNLMAEKQKASPQERKDFINNPLPAITRRVEEHLEKTGKLENLDDIEREEMIESFSEPLIVETREYSQRVTGTTKYIKQDNRAEASQQASTWLPEHIPDIVTQLLENLDIEGLEALKEEVKTAREAGKDHITLAQCPIPSSQIIEDILDARITLLNEIKNKEIEQQCQAEIDASAPIILTTEDNINALAYRPKHAARTPHIPLTIPKGIKTPLHPHQQESFQAQLTSWCAGMPGILNADEQGLGKTLQTIAFLRWLHDNADAAPNSESKEKNGPILIVAPTTLLENWCAEVEHHCDYHGLGTLIPLYGTHLSRYKKSNGSGIETINGEERLDFSNLHQAISDGHGHRFWLLTTYTTLTNYQHSLGLIKFSAIIFDEIQALKNANSLRATGARAMNAHYHIGLTGTPIENTTSELWSVMDQIVPGSMGSLKDFNAEYKDPLPDSMAKLYEHVFKEQKGQPPLAFRRLKSQVAKNLPIKRRFLYPYMMPTIQIMAYDNAKLTQDAGGALKMLSHIRGVSVHPSINMEGTDEDYIAASARLTACFNILDDIKQKNERVLIFIEHINMQHHFIERAKKRYHLNNIDLINGKTPIAQRQKIVKRFQNHLTHDGGFDLLVLGPKAAGTGLTLTAATHVIHLSRWWNPAVEEQCNDRVHRIGQTKPVNIHIPIAIHKNYLEDSFDCQLQSLMARKRHLAQSVLWPMGDTSEDFTSLLHSLKAETRTATNQDPIEHTMEQLFQRDKQQGVKRISSHCWEIEALS